MVDEKDIDWVEIYRRTAVIILGGGQGKRLYPLTKERSKPAVPIAGKFRLIDLPLSNCIHSGLDRVYILTQFNSDSLHRHITQAYRFDYFSRGFVQILAAQQTPQNTDWYQGTADAVRHAMRRFANNRPEYVLILSGDHLYRMDYRTLLRMHFQFNADVTIPVLPVERERCQDFGILKIDEDSRINEFVEKPKEDPVLDELKVPQKVFEDQGVAADGRNYIASMGIYLFDCDTLIEALESSDEPDFGKHILPALLKPKRVYSYFFDDYWEDIGTIKSFYNANLDLTKSNPEFDFYEENRLIFSRPRFLPASKVDGARIRQSLIADGAIVAGSSVEESIIGLRGIVAEGGEVYRTVMMGADYYDGPDNRYEDVDPGAPPLGIGPRTIIKNSIIDKNARIGADCKIMNEEGIQEADGDCYFIRDGIVVIPRSAIVPDGTVI